MRSTDPPKTLRFKCPKCAKSIRVPVSMQGKSGECPGCSTSIKIPIAKPTKNPANLMPPVPASSTAHVIMIDEFICDGMHHVRLLTKESIAGGMVPRKKGPDVLRQLTQRHDVINVIKENADWGQQPTVIAINCLKSVELVEDDGACLTFVHSETGKSKIKRTQFGLSSPSERRVFVQLLEKVTGEFHVHKRAQSIWEIGKTYLLLSSLGAALCAIPLIGGNPTEVTRGRNRLMAEFLNLVGPTAIFSIGLLFILTMLMCWYFSCKNPSQVTIFEVDRNGR